MVAELPADFGSFEALSIEGELQAIYLALLILHTLYGNAVFVQFIKEHGMPCDACISVLVKHGITDLLHHFLCLLSRLADFCLLVFPFRLNLLCDGQAFLSAYFLRHPCSPIAHKGGIKDFSIQTDAVGDDVNVSVVGVLVRYCYPLVVVKSYSFGKQMCYPHIFGHRQLFLVLRCDANFDTEKLVPATAVVVTDHFHFLIDSLWISAAKIVECKPTTEFAFPENIVQSCASVRYRLAFTYHFLLDLRPYIFHHLPENAGRKTA